MEVNIQNQDHRTTQEWYDFLKICENFRQGLIYHTSNVVKNKKSFGTEIVLDFNPKYFLVPYADFVEHWDISNKDVKIKRYTKDAWFYPFCTVESTKERYHPSFKNLCPVLHNAEHNPIVLKDENDLKQASYISRMITNRYKNGDTSYLIYTTLAVKEDGVLELIPNDNYKLFTPTKGQLTLEINGRPTTRAADLINFFEALTNQFLYKKGYSLHKDYMVVHRLLDSYVQQWFLDQYISNRDLSIADMLREQHKEVEGNPALYDLPYNEIQLLHFYNKRRYQGRMLNRDEEMTAFMANLNQKLKLGDTKQATDACFFGNQYPASIKKLMLKADPLEFHHHTYTAISESVAKIGVDKTRIFITDVNNDGELDYRILSRSRLMRAFSYGWNVNVIKDMQKARPTKKSKQALNAKVHLVIDAADMYLNLLQKEVVLNLPSNNINEIHDYLSPIYTLYRQAESSAEMTALKTTDTSNQLKSLIVDGYEVRSPYTAAELMDVGTQMRHCVASYANKFFYRQVEIALLTDSAGEYLVCIEIHNGYVLQAKMKFNKPVSGNELYLGMVMDFIELNNLKSDSYDINQPTNNYNYYGDDVNKDPSRIAIVDAIRQAKKDDAQAA